ncbi:P-loop containing nucleoside triphosphate hydrolase protein [Daldinia eschscholtzii]|nr:P-loop containing nucleoside triphosphate hydrolase protein [Daldinia eschscholtzii]
MVQTSIVGIYRAALDFFYESNKWISSCPTGIFRYGPKPPLAQVRASIEKYKKARANLELAIPLASLNLHRGWHQEIKAIVARATAQPLGSLPCRFIPYPNNPRFIQRDGIHTAMQTALADGRTGQISFALYGAGGVGKTQIALQYIYDHLDRYPAIFWMAADSLSTLTQSYVDAAKQLQIEPSGSQREQDAVVQSFKSWLSDTSANWIIVYDNVDDLSILRSFWPPTHRGTVIITSRDPASARLAMSSVQVRSMTEEEGLDLFRLSHENLEMDKAKEVLNKLGRLPLAINQAANFIAERSCSIEDFLEAYTESLNDENIFTSLNVDCPNLFYTHSLATVWKSSIERLSPDSANLLSTLSYLDPCGIPEAIIRNGAFACNGSGLLSSAGSYTAAVKELLRTGLIWKTNELQITPQNESGTKSTCNIGLHTLVKEMVFHRQALALRNQTFGAAVEICLGAFPHVTRSNFCFEDQRSQYEILLPHLLALNDRYKDSPEIIADLRLAQLFLYAGRYLYEKRVPEVAIPLLTTACTICDAENSGANWILRSRILSMFGCVLFQCSMYEESEVCLRKALALQLENMESDDTLLAHEYRNLSLLISGQAKHETPIGLEKEALDFAEKNSQHATYSDMPGHDAPVREVVTSTKCILPNSQRELSWTLYHLSRVYTGLDMREQAMEYLDAAWKLRARLTGEKRPGIKGAGANDEAEGFDKSVAYIYS